MNLSSCARTGLLRAAFGGLVCIAAASPLAAHTGIEEQIEALDRHVAQSPKDGEAYFHRAELERSLHRWDAARADYDRAARLTPGLTALELAVGTMWLEAGRADKALPRLERFLGSSPEHPLGHLMKARALAQLKRWRTAVKEYDQALALFTTAQPEFYLERASAQTAQGSGAIRAAILGLNDGAARLGGAISLQLAALDLELASKRYDDALARLGEIAARSPRPEIWRARREAILEKATLTPDVARRAAMAPPAPERKLAAGSRAVTGNDGDASGVAAEGDGADGQFAAGSRAVTGNNNDGDAGADPAKAPLVSVTRGPYLQRGSPSSVIVRWRTSPATNSRVRFGSSPGSLTQFVDDQTSTTEHFVTLSGLDAATTYYYSIGTTAAPLAGGDSNHFFLTAPPPGRASPYRFWVIGDSGTADNNARDVRDAYATYTGTVHTNLWLMLGDNAYTNGTDSEYQAAVFDMYGAMLRKSVLWPTYGNHDSFSADATTQSGPYFDIFSLPTGAQAGGVPSGTEAYYSFEYGNVHFICLDSMDNAYRSPSGAQMIWLQQDLAAASKNWIVAFWHHPPYSRGSHNSDNPNGSDYQLVEMRQNFLPVLEQAGVDLVLSGHSHSYERSFLIDGHYGLSGTFTNAMKKDGGDGRPVGNGAYTKATLGKAPHEGAVYAVAGSSGQISGGALDHPAMYISLNRLGSLVLDVNGGRLDATFIDNLGTIRDSFTLLKGGPTPLPVPGGESGFGSAATAEKLTADGSAIRLAWDGMACGTSTQYEVLWGKESDLPTYSPSGAACNIGNTGSYDWIGAPPVPGGERFLWWTIVGTDGLNQEGSWGYNSSGAERHPGLASGLCGITAKNIANGCP